MAQIGCCSFLRSSEWTPCYGKYDFDLWRPLLVDFEEPNIVELRAAMGRQIISALPARFRSENNGRFIAVTFTGKILAVCNTLEALNKEIASKHLKENYYIERLGHNTIAQI